MMTAMTTPESGDVAARLAQASRLIRHAQSLAEKIAELTEDGAGQRRLADAELEKAALKEIARGNF
jgi:hypothetical protein